MRTMSATQWGRADRRGSDSVAPSRVIVGGFPLPSAEQSHRRRPPLPSADRTHQAAPLPRSVVAQHLVQCGRDERWGDSSDGSPDPPADLTGEEAAS